MNELSPSSKPALPPVARPVDIAVIPAPVVPIARALSRTDDVRYVVVKRTTEPFAVASAICGMTAIIPVLSQLVGLSLGVVSLVRLRRARRNGIDLAGKGWAIAGIVTSGFALIGWIGFAVALTSVGSSLLGSSDVLNSLLVTPSP